MQKKYSVPHSIHTSAHLIENLALFDRPVLIDVAVLAHNFLHINNFRGSLGCEGVHLVGAGELSRAWVVFDSNVFANFLEHCLGIINLPDMILDRKFLQRMDSRRLSYILAQSRIAVQGANFYRQDFVHPPA